MGFSVVTVLDSESSTALRTQSASVVASSLTHPKQPPRPIRRTQAHRLNEKETRFLAIVRQHFLSTVAKTTGFAAYNAALISLGRRCCGTLLPFPFKWQRGLYLDANALSN
jgi:hypothetical protein